MKKPSSLDTVPMISLNTRIACSGIENAEAGYRQWCGENEFAIDEWVINYIRLYRKYRKRSIDGTGFIDVKAAHRALREA
jgi:hypothetical protein